MQQLILGLILIAIAAILGFYGTQFASKGWTQVFSHSDILETESTNRPYVVITSTKLSAQSEDKPVEVVFDIKNTGLTEAKGSFSDFTYYFSTNPEQLEFLYQKAKSSSFTLAPEEQWQSHFFPSFVLTAEKRQLLDSGKARLFFYAKGSYRDSNGNIYEFPFSRMYHPKISGNLAMCPDEIEFK